MLQLTSLSSLQEVERLADEIVNDIVLEQAQGGLGRAYNSVASCCIHIQSMRSPAAAELISLCDGLAEEAFENEFAAPIEAH